MLNFTQAQTNDLDLYQDIARQGIKKEVILIKREGFIKSEQLVKPIYIKQGNIITMYFDETLLAHA